MYNRNKRRWCGVVTLLPSSYCKTKYDSTNESADVKALVKQFHTDAVKKAFNEYLEKQKLQN